MLVLYLSQDYISLRGNDIICYRTTVRKTRSAGLEGTDGTTIQRRQLGTEGSDFEFSQLLPQRVSVIECSAKGSTPAGDKPELEEVSQWLQSI